MKASTPRQCNRCGHQFYGLPFAKVCPDCKVTEQAAAILQAAGGECFAVPVKVKGFGTFPVRAFAIVDPTVGS